MKSATTSEISDAATKDKSDSYNVETMDMSKAFVSDETTESASIIHEEKLKSVVTHEVTAQPVEIVLRVNFDSEAQKNEVLRMVGMLGGIDFVEADIKEAKLMVRGDFNPLQLLFRVRKIIPDAYMVDPNPQK